MNVGKKKNKRNGFRKCKNDTKNKNSKAIYHFFKTVFFFVNVLTLQNFRSSFFQFLLHEDFNKFYFNWIISFVAVLKHSHRLFRLLSLELKTNWFSACCFSFFFYCLFSSISFLHAHHCVIVFESREKTLCESPKMCSRYQCKFLAIKSQ